MGTTPALIEQRMEETRQKLVSGVAAGTIATILMTALLVAAPSLAGARMPEIAARALAAWKARPLLIAVGMVLHLGYGALAGALFAVAARRINVTSGLFFGLALWGVAVAVYAPLVGLGFVAKHEPALAAIVLPAHLLYGATLGALAPRGEIVQPIEPAIFADA
jgi:hypothetical protein